MAAADTFADGAARYLAQFSHGIYGQVSDQLMRQAAVALPEVALRYLQAHAQRGDDVQRRVRYEHSADWFELEHVQVEYEIDEDDWAVIDKEHQRLARMVLGSPGPRRRAGWAAVPVLAAGVGCRLVTLPLTVGSTTLWVGSSAAKVGMGAAMSLAGLGPPAPLPSLGVPPWDRFVEEPPLTVGDQEWWFRTWLPFESSREVAGGKTPVLLLLHGYSECGWDNYWQCQSGLATLLQDWEFARDFPAIVVLPQLPRKPWGVRWWEGWRESSAQDAVMAMLRYAQRRYGGDPSRVYVVGESLGGEGAWQLAKRFPRTFAGCAAACGSLEPYDWESWEWGEDGDVYEEVASGAQAPFWFCHGTEDPYVPIEHARKLHRALRTAREGGSWFRAALCLVGLRRPKEVVFKEYDAHGHDVWNRAYQEDDLIEWLFKQRL